MAQHSIPIAELKEKPIAFLKTDEFLQMMETYERLKPLEDTKPLSFRQQLKDFDFEQIFPVMDDYLSAHDLSTPEALDAVFTEAAEESVTFARTLLDTYEARAEALITEYDILGNSPATYFIGGVWANMKRGREFHPASNGITVTYSDVDAYGNQSVRYRNKDYEMTLVFEAVQEYTKNLSWTAHRLLVYTLMKGNIQNWRGGAAEFNINEYMEWAGLKSRDAAYRQLKKDVQSITGVKLTAESFKKYFESFYTTHLATEAHIKKYTGEIRIAFADNVRLFLTQYYQLIPDWMGQLNENSYRMAFYLYYRARKAPLDEGGHFNVRVEDIIKYIGLPTKEEVKNRNYDEAIMKPFNKAVEEIEKVSHGSLTMDFEYDNINTFMAGQMTVGVDDTMRDYIHKIETSRSAKQLEAKKKRRKKGEETPAETE